jgi:Homeodomain-like domain
MDGPEIRQEALRLVAAGLNDCEVARRIGVARTTVRDWRRPKYVPKRPRDEARTCPRCWKPCTPLHFVPADYAELIGLYLGDGYISHSPRTQRLRIYLDARYTVVVDEAEALLRRGFAENRVGRVVGKRGTMVVLSTYQHLSCLLPQHGPGKKHERPIRLEPWQQVIVSGEPWAFLRGCIRSDGCVFINRTGRYEYLSYHFRNRSADIRELFVATCAEVGVHCCVSGDHVRINRRACVARFQEHVGLKR